MDTKEALEQILAASNKPDTKDRIVSRFVIGKHIRQGDISIIRLDALPNREMDRTQERQLVAGNTLGSRHTLTGEAEIYCLRNAGPLEGPVFLAVDNVRIAHPTHADVYLPDGGTYSITYQRDFAAEEVARLAD